MAELVRAWENGDEPSTVPGLALRRGPLTATRMKAARGSPLSGILRTAGRILERDLDSLALPARELLPNALYRDDGIRRHGHSVTSIMSTRGCPFSCEFCSNTVFGVTYRKRSAQNVVDEVEQALALGYERIHFADDVFTLDKERVGRICDEIIKRGLRFGWECLGRVDSIDRPLALHMKEAGCDRILFGIESGSDSILLLMNKKITSHAARKAVETAHNAGLKTGAFFILFYPGETDQSVLETLRFAGSLPLDYLSYATPRPIPGTRLYQRIAGPQPPAWDPSSCSFSGQPYDGHPHFSRGKIRFGVFKGRVEFGLKKRLGVFAPFAGRLFRKPTELIQRLLR